MTTPTVALPVTDRDTPFLVSRIWCVGANYSAHVREMGRDANAAPPFFFSKPFDAVVVEGGDVPYPPATSELHHEVELVVAIDRDGRDLEPPHALEHVLGYAVGLDLTRRDVQRRAKQQGRPWALSKGFDHSAPCSAIALVSDVGHPAAAGIALEVNGQLRQQGDIADMTWSVAEILSHLSRQVCLRAGDLVFTGTPAGVGPLLPGDQVDAWVDGIARLQVTVTDRRQ
jgi:fumarylpyruvate hydrolase